MPGPWDDLMKQFVRTKPEHLIAWVLERATLQERLSEELNVTLYADGLFLVSLDDKQMLINLEFQSIADKRMGERLQEYNVLASRSHRYLPVHSVVIYLRRSINVAPSPLIRRLLDGRQNHRFDFGEIELANIPAQQLLETELLGLLPLVILTNGGTKPEVVDTMTSRLAAAREKELLAISYALGGLAFPDKDAQQWYRKRFHMFEEAIQDTWVYKEIGEQVGPGYFERGMQQGIQKGLEQGIQKGLEQGLEQGKLKGFEEGELRALRQVVLDVVRERFPELETAVKTFVEASTDAVQLRRLNVKMSTVPNIQEAALALLLIDKDEQK